jgi:hypothetical protein
MNESYRLLLTKESTSENGILRDVNRTFPAHPYFQDENGQQSLYKLCKAYSIYDEEVGYCQGLSFLIASLLLHMPEEQTFNLLVKIMYRYELREIYKASFECLHLRFYQLESLIRECLPDLHEHFVDLNIEPHMFASQWFLTVYTAKFPLYMVFRILDLFLYEGYSVILSIALALLKSSQRDLLALDFEGVLKYFRVSMPKKFRNESKFQELMQLWLPLHSKISDKKLKKLEQKYKQMKEQEALKEDPLIRYEKELKRLNILVRRLEQENDDLANEYIDYKVANTKQMEELRDDYEVVKSELIKYKTNYQSKISESSETNKRLMSELDQIKTLWRKESERYEVELERSKVIINEYKQICNKLSDKMDKWSQFKKLYDQRGKKYVFCDLCTENNKLVDLESEQNGQKNQSQDSPSKVLSTTSFDEDSSLEILNDVNNKADNLLENIESSSTNKENLEKIRVLELELARVKLELVDAQCKNQEYDHKFKNLNAENPSLINSLASRSNSSDIGGSQTSLSSAGFYNMNSNQTSNNSNDMNSIAITPTNNGNSWFTKTISQIKEATNQAVIKAQKGGKLNSNNTGSPSIIDQKYFS